MKQIIAGFLFVVGSANGAEVWSVRSHACPGDVLKDGYVIEGRGKVMLPFAPGESAESVKAFIRRSTLVFRDLMKDLPDGSLVVLDGNHHTLAARTTEKGHELIKSMLEEWLVDVPLMLACQVDLLEVASADIEALLEETGSNLDHAAVLEQLENMGASVVASASFETKSGQRISSEMVTNVRHFTEIAARADGSSEGDGMEEPVGMTVEVDPVIATDGRTLLLDVSIRHTTMAGALRTVPLGTVGGKRVKAVIQDFATEKWKTNTVLLAGQTRLLGVAPADEEGKTRLCFVSASVPKVELAISNRAEGWLRRYGDTVEKVPSEPAKRGATQGPPSCMVVKRFPVPPDFLSWGKEASGGSEPEFNVRLTSQDILKAQGIAFPDGASSTFNKTTSFLTVVNLPENVAQVEELLDSMFYCPPALIRFHLHVVEAASGVVRKLGRESLAVTDHRAAWEALQAEIAAGRGRVVGVAAIETKSGQRCTVESGRLYAWANANLKPQVLEAKEEKGALAVPIAELVATVEREPLGLHWEIDPVLGADGYTIDVNTSVRRHSQAPTERFDAPVAREGSLTVDAPAVDFHPLELTTAFTTQNGMWRMIGTWQPVGADGGLDPDVMQAIFVRATVVRVE